MREHIIASSRFFFGIVVAIFTIGYICALNMSVGFVVLMLGGGVMLFAVPLGAAIFTYYGIRWGLQPDETWPRRIAVVLAAPALLGLCLVAAMPALATGMLAGTATRLFWNQRSYAAIIETERRRAGPEPFVQPSSRGIRYLVDRGPPLRVVFNPEGLLDKWSGIVFDPTHQVMLAEAFDSRGQFRAPRHITELFGGDLVSCRPLWGDYFHCSFT